MPFSKIIIDNLLSIASIDITDLTTYSPTEFLRLKLYLSLVGSLIISYPLWLRGIYNFSSPALTNKEKKGFQTCFSMGFVIFITGAFLGLYYVAPIIFEVLLVNDNVTIAKLSIYETITLLISISLFSGILLSLPLLTLFLTDYSSSKIQLRKYLYALIVAIVILGTPDPSMIINIIFLVLFAIIIEITLVFGGKNEN